MCIIMEAFQDILGKKDNDPVLNDLRWYRDNHLKSDSEGVKMAVEYVRLSTTLEGRLSNDGLKKVVHFAEQGFSCVKSGDYTGAKKVLSEVLTYLQEVEASLEPVLV